MIAGFLAEATGSAEKINAKHSAGEEQQPVSHMIRQAAGRGVRGLLCVIDCQNSQYMAMLQFKATILLLSKQ